MSHERKTTEWPVLYPFRGERLSIREIAKIGGISSQSVRRRMDRGVPADRWADPVLTQADASRLAGIARGRQIVAERLAKAQSEK